jgi:hypothetical protein
VTDCTQYVVAEKKMARTEKAAAEPVLVITHPRPCRISGVQSKQVSEWSGGLRRHHRESWIDLCRSRPGRGLQ